MANLYKYLPFDSFREAYFKNELMRFTQPDDLNDPFECLPSKPTYEELENFKKNLISKFPNSEYEKLIRKTINNKYLDNLYKEAYENVNKDTVIFSLSKNWNNILMWSHYANSHQGFCIGYKSEDNFFKNILLNNGEKSKFIFDVIYSENRYKIPMIPEERELSFKPFITKSIDWKYEDEVRIVASSNLAEITEEKKPYNICLFKVPHSAISEIILGANIKSENEKFIRKFCKNNNINIYKCIKSENKFNMDRI